MVGGLGVEKQIWLSHEARDHPDDDLSARLGHLWHCSSEVGVCDMILVWDLGI
jgi:hypothetical protein